MVRILLSHRGLTQKNLKIRAELHYNKMNGNVVYAALQPQVTTLKVLIDVYSVALTNALGGRVEDTKIKNKAKDEVDNCITKIAKTLELMADDLPESEREAFINGAGFEMVQAPTKKNLAFLEKPTNLSAVDILGMAGAVKINFKKNEDTVNCGIEYLPDGETVWRNGTYTTASSTILTGLKSGTYVAIRIYGTGRKGLKSDVTEPVIVLVS